MPVLFGDWGAQIGITSTIPPVTATATARVLPNAWALPRRHTEPVSGLWADLFHHQSLLG